MPCLLVDWHCASHPSRKVRGEDGSPGGWCWLDGGDVACALVDFAGSAGAHGFERSDILIAALVLGRQESVWVCGVGLLLGWRCASHPSRKVRDEDGSPAVFTVVEVLAVCAGVKDRCFGWSECRG